MKNITVLRTLLLFPVAVFCFWLTEVSWVNPADKYRVGCYENGFGARVYRVEEWERWNDFYIRWVPAHNLEYGDEATAISKVEALNAGERFKESMSYHRVGCVKQ